MLHAEDPPKTNKGVNYVGRPWSMSNRGKQKWELGRGRAGVVGSASVIVRMFN